MIWVTKKSKWCDDISVSLRSFVWGVNTLEITKVWNSISKTSCFKAGDRFWGEIVADLVSK